MVISQIRSIFAPDTYQQQCEFMEQNYSNPQRGLFTSDHFNEFMLSFFSVVLGIVLTFGGEALIRHRQEQNDLRACLQLVASELRENGDLLHLCDSLLDDQLMAASFLITYEDDLAKAPSDSLDYISNIPLMMWEISIYTDAFELLKSSDVLTKLEDKQLALDIFKIYGDLQDCIVYSKFYYDHRKTYFDKVMTDEMTEILSHNNTTSQEFWGAILKHKEGRQFIREIIRFLRNKDNSEVKDKLEATIKRLESF